MTATAPAPKLTGPPRVAVWVLVGEVAMMMFNALQALALPHDWALQLHPAALTCSCPPGSGTEAGGTCANPDAQLLPPPGAELYRHTGAATLALAVVLLLALRSGGEPLRLMLSGLLVGDLFQVVACFLIVRAWTGSAFRGWDPINIVYVVTTFTFTAARLVWLHGYAALKRQRREHSAGLLRQLEGVERALRSSVDLEREREYGVPATCGAGQGAEPASEDPRPQQPHYPAVGSSGGV